MFKSFKEHINENLSFLNGSKLLITISGGVDSVVLTHICHQLNLNIALAHCNFNLRGKESDADEDFVLQLAEDLNVEVFVESFEIQAYAKQNKLSTQMAARELRYNWFKELALQSHFDYILTAHHADDNFETFLINLTRGTGLDGLTGIPEINNNIVRPLLKFSREDIERYAKSNNVNWREDSSNATTKYLRNKLRHDVIPVLKELNPQLLQNFETTQNHLQDSKVIIEDAVAKIKRKVVSVEDGIIKLHIKKLQKLSNTKAYLFELLKDFNFTAWDDVVNLLDAQPGKEIYSKTHRLVKDRNFLLLQKNNSDAIQDNVEELQIIELQSKELKIPQGTLMLEAVEQIGEINQSTIYVDKDLLKYPLTVRKWQKGDYFYPFGMQGKKKLSKFFKDEKLSLIDKENVRLLCSDNEIFWILNMRLDNRFKISDKTKNILKIRLK